jgi:RimJ/RimL family protein N-acetyltransferase
VSRCGHVEDLGLSRVLAQTMAVNEGLRAVVTSIGMTFVRWLTGGFDEPLPGSDEGEVEYAISRHQWQSNCTDN